MQPNDAPSVMEQEGPQDLLEPCILSRPHPAPVTPSESVQNNGPTLRGVGLEYRGEGIPQRSPNSIRSTENQRVNSASYSNEAPPALERHRKNRAQQAAREALQERDPQQSIQNVRAGVPNRHPEDVVALAGQPPLGDLPI